MAKIFKWDDTISNDGNGTLPFIVLADGVYEFEVTKLDKTFYQGTSTKIPASCPEADLELMVKTSEGISIIRERIFLYDDMEWKISAFFRCLGLKQYGQSVVMPWGKVLGAKGKAVITSRTWTSNDGTEKKSNIIKSYIDSDVKPVIKKAVAPTADSDLPFEI